MLFSNQRTARGASVLALAAAVLAAALPAKSAPAWWHFTSGRSEVWLIGAPNLAPKNFGWDSRVAEERLKGASVLIIEPQAKGNPFALAGDLFGAARGLRSDTPLEPSLPPPLRQHFQTIRTSIGQGPGKYSRWKASAAGVILTNDFLKAQGLETGQTIKDVRRLARGAGVQELPSGFYEGIPIIAAAEQLNSAGQQACLGASLHDIDQAPARLRMAQDWSRGVIHPNPTDPADQACFNAMPQLQSLNDRLISSEAQAVVDALKRPGRSVAVFDLGATVMPDGVLDKIRAHGVAVPAPAP
ncbi:MAG TPA: TraB/GumN family protein [Caulobacteraceae bacterium]|jgi:uncharacterized protein YbaP (TraB family)|nr:TraB/GumN family protein [Caulobacteraceae bacterium]